MPPAPWHLHAIALDVARDAHVQVRWASFCVMPRHAPPSQIACGGWNRDVGCTPRARLPDARAQVAIEASSASRYGHDVPAAPSPSPRVSVHVEVVVQVDLPRADAPVVAFGAGNLLCGSSRRTANPRPRRGGVLDGNRARARRCGASAAARLAGRERRLHHAERLRGTYRITFNVLRRATRPSGDSRSNTHAAAVSRASPLQTPARSRGCPQPMFLSECQTVREEQCSRAGSRTYAPSITVTVFVARCSQWLYFPISSSPASTFARFSDR